MARCASSSCPRPSRRPSALDRGQPPHGGQPHRRGAAGGERIEKPRIPRGRDERTGSWGRPRAPQVQRGDAMSEPFPPPPKGAMYLFDYARPPLPPDLYRMEVKTDVSFEGESHLLQDDRYFEVVGPRFALEPTDVAGVFPPRNGHGPFMNSLAHIAIKRRTLPWERSLDKGDSIGDPSDGKVLPGDALPLPGSDPPPYPTPWLAL